MKKKRTLTLCNILSLVVLGSCSYKKLEFDYKSGKFNTVLAGDKFRISLPENHAQNYYWSLRHNSNKKAADYLGSVFHGDKSGEVDFNFEALQLGETEINLTYYHYNDSISSVTYKVNVIE